jgi:hypothetical protein
MLFSRAGSVALLLLAGAAALTGSRQTGQRTFATPQEAAHALLEAAENNDTGVLLKIFGQKGKSIVVSGDPAEDRETRARFARLAREKLQIRQDPNRDVIVAGSDEWPFPVPLVETNGRWRFDPAQVKAEVLAERTRRNEIEAIEVCRGYVQAQMDYSAQHGGAGGHPQYAQRIASSPGATDGLYREGDVENLVPQSFAQAAASMFNRGKKPAPYSGYNFRILKARGPGADGGELDYVVNRQMTGGFALVAYPAEYGVSGVRTFLVNEKALVYGKDLGPATGTMGRRMTSYDPDQTWKAVALE